jgi:hypothetical protein
MTARRMAYEAIGISAEHASGAGREHPRCPEAGDTWPEITDIR